MSRVGSFLIEILIRADRIARDKDDLKNHSSDIISVIQVGNSVWHRSIVRKVSSICSFLIIA